MAEGLGWRRSLSQICKLAPYPPPTRTIMIHSKSGQVFLFSLFLSCPLSETNCSWEKDLWQHTMLKSTVVAKRAKGSYMPLLPCNLGMCIVQGQIFYCTLSDERPQSLKGFCWWVVETCCPLPSNGECVVAGCPLLRQFLSWLKMKGEPMCMDKKSPKTQVELRDA